MGQGGLQWGGVGRGAEGLRAEREGSPAPVSAGHLLSQPLPWNHGFPWEPADATALLLEKFTRYRVFFAI